MRLKAVKAGSTPSGATPQGCLMQERFIPRMPGGEDENRGGRLQSEARHLPIAPALDLQPNPI
jgi:hypothetical protein